MKTLIAISLGLFLSITASSQTCLPDGIVFTTQAQIDSFQINYPGCTEIYGNVYIGYQDYESNITNLTGLNSLQSIRLDLYIWYDNSLINLIGLENLNYIGRDLYIAQNDSLITLQGIENLISIGGDISIIGNNALCTCEIQSICNYLANPTGSVDIYNNANGCQNPFSIASACGITITCLPFGNYNLLSQTDVDNFQTNYPECTDLEGQVVISGSNISNLNGLSKVTSIGNWLIIEYADSLLNLSGLDNLNSTGGLLIWFNLKLTSMSGLDNLISINGHVLIGENDSLQDLGGLENLNSIGGSLDIDYNTRLNNIKAIENIESATITDLYIYGNPNLSTCQIESICDYLANPNGVVLIQENAVGCNDQEEVEAACDVGLKEAAISESLISIYPNPASTHIIIEASIPINNGTLKILNLQGHELYHYQIKGSKMNIDISDLTAGVYFVRFSSENTVTMFKVLKY